MESAKKLSEIKSNFEQVSGLYNGISIHSSEENIADVLKCKAYFEMDQKFKEIEAANTKSIETIQKCITLKAQASAEVITNVITMGKILDAISALMAQTTAVHEVLVKFLPSVYRLQEISKLESLYEAAVKEVGFQTLLKRNS